MKSFTTFFIIKSVVEVSSLVCFDLLPTGFRYGPSFWRCYFVSNRNIATSFTLNNFTFDIGGCTWWKFNINITICFITGNGVFEGAVVAHNICKLENVMTVHQIFVLIGFFKTSSVIVADSFVLLF